MKYLKIFYHIESYITIHFSAVQQFCELYIFFHSKLLRHNFILHNNVMSSILCHTIAKKFKRIGQRGSIRVCTK